MNYKKNNSGTADMTLSVGFCQSLTLIFITLKLTKHIDWSWWWVLALLWIPMAVFIVVILCIRICAYIQDKFVLK